MPAEGLAWLPKSEILTFEESTRLLGVFVGLGVRSIKVTGGEPTVRADLPTLVRMFREVGPELDISITTNGVLLDRLAGPLAEAGVDRATVSCDSLMRHRFAEMTRRDALDKVFAGLKAAEEAGLTPIKINTVVIGGTNDDEVVEFARWSRETGYEVRFIEYMPLDAEHAWERAKVVPSARILETIAGDVPAVADRARERAGHLLRVRRRRAGADRRHRERDRAVLRHVQPPPADGRGTGARLPVLAGGDRPARAHARRRDGRGARGPDPHHRLAQVVGSPHQPRRLRAAGAQHVDDRRLSPPPTDPAPTPATRTGGGRPPPVASSFDRSGLRAAVREREAVERRLLAVVVERVVDDPRRRDVVDVRERLRHPRHDVFHHVLVEVGPARGTARRRAGSPRTPAILSSTSGTVVPAGYPQSVSCFSLAPSSE